jgi:hypothetical protein
MADITVRRIHPEWNFKTTGHPISRDIRTARADGMTAAQDERP